MPNIFETKNPNKSVNDPSVADPADKLIKKPINFSDYEDPSGEMGGREFRLALWYARNKVLLHRWTVVAIVVVNIIFWSVSAIGWLSYFVVGIDRDRLMATELASFYDYNLINSHFAPASLEVANPSALAGGVKLYDVFADVANPNRDFYVNFDYYFIVNGVPTPRQSSILLANDSRPVVYFGWSGQSFPAVGSIVIENVRWHRIDSHVIVDSASWQAERLNFSVDQFKFTSAYYNDLSSSGVINFDITNGSAYSYASLTFYVGLFQGNTLVGLKPLTLSALRSQETQSVDLRTFVDNLNLTGVKLFPIINIFNPTSFLSPTD